MNPRLRAVFCDHLSIMRVLLFLNLASSIVLLNIGIVLTSHRLVAWAQRGDPPARSGLGQEAGLERRDQPRLDQRGLAAAGDSDHAEKA